LTKLPTFNLSHSAISTYLECPEKFHLSYIEKIENPRKGSSLYFGSAVEAGINHILEGLKSGNLEKAKKEAFKQFMKKWQSLFDDKNVYYTEADYDKKLFLSDELIFEKYDKELNITSQQAIEAFFNYPDKEPNEVELKYYNRIAWTSMARKADIMLKGFISEILPKIKKVVAIQHRIDGNVGEKNIKGYVDYILDIEGYDTSIILDCKTSATPYKSEKIFMSPQLTLYSAALSDAINSNLAGFLVFVKSIQYDAICGKCGFQKDGSHKTCNNGDKKNRCNGEWIFTPKAFIQLMVDEISKERQQDYLNTVEEITKVISVGARIKNWDSCSNFGGCEYYNKCHYNKLEEYVPKTYK